MFSFLLLLSHVTYYFSIPTCFCFLSIVVFFFYSVLVVSLRLYFTLYSFFLFYVSSCLYVYFVLPVLFTLPFFFLIELFFFHFILVVLQQRKITLFTLKVKRYRLLALTEWLYSFFLFYVSSCLYVYSVLPVCLIFYCFSFFSF